MFSQELQNKLSFNIYRAGLLLRRELIHVLAEYKINPEQWQVLMTLWEIQKPITQQELVDKTLKDRHTISRMIARLVRDGWIQKHSHETDKRSILLTLSPKGKKSEKEMKERMRIHFRKVWKDFSAIEKRDLLLSLKKLRIFLGDES